MKYGTKLRPIRSWAMHRAVMIWRQCIGSESTTIGCAVSSITFASGCFQPGRKSRIITARLGSLPKAESLNRLPCSFFFKARMLKDANIVTTQQPDESRPYTHAEVAAAISSAKKKPEPAPHPDLEHGWLGVELGIRELRAEVQREWESNFSQEFPGWSRAMLFGPLRHSLACRPMILKVRAASSFTGRRLRKRKRDW